MDDRSVALEQGSVGWTTDKGPMTLKKSLDLTRKLHLALGKDDQVIARPLQVGVDGQTLRLVRLALPSCATL